MNEIAEKSLWSKLVSIFWEPSSTFKSLSEKPKWIDIIIPIILVSIVSMISMPIVNPIAMEETKAKFEESEKYSDAQKEIMIDTMDARKDSKLGYIFAPIVIFIKTAIMGIILMFAGNFLLGGDRKFMTLFAVSSYVGLVDLISSAVKIPLIYQKGSLQVYTSIAMFMGDSSTFLFRFINALDLFAFWKVYLFGLALSIIYKKKMSQTFIVILVLWILYSLITAALGGMVKI